MKVYLDIILHYTVERIIDEDTASLGWLLKVYLDIILHYTVKRIIDEDIQLALVGY